MAEEPIRKAFLERDTRADEMYFLWNWFRKPSMVILRWKNISQRSRF